MRIALLVGGTSPERHVSFASGRGMHAALLELGHEVTIHDVARGSASGIEPDELQQPGREAPSTEELGSLDPAAIVEAIAALPDEVDLAVIALHGVPGEDGSVQSLLELRGIPYTGSGPLASALAMDKEMSKRLLEAAGVATPRWFLRERGEAEEMELLDLVERVTGWPVVVKPNDGGSTVGLTIVEDASGLVAAYRRASEYSRYVLFEEYVPGRELTVPIVGEDALPIVEIRPHSGIYDYVSKYTPGLTEYIVPAELPAPLVEELRELARRAHEALRCEGYSRVDFRLDEDGEPWCLEVNTLPGMTATSLVPKAASAAGISFSALLDRIVHSALERSPRNLTAD